MTLHYHTVWTVTGTMSFFFDNLHANRRVYAISIIWQNLPYMYIYFGFEDFSLDYMLPILKCFNPNGISADVLPQSPSAIMQFEKRQIANCVCFLGYPPDSCPHCGHCQRSALWAAPSAYWAGVSCELRSVQSTRTPALAMPISRRE